MKNILMPREHGAYAQLAFPLLSGLILGRCTLVGSAFAFAALAFFLAYEPAVVLSGIRGVRLQQERSNVARLQLIATGAVGMFFGGSGFFLATSDVRILALLPAAFCLVLVPLLLARRVKTLGGELVVAAALASAHVPIAGAGGAAGLRLWGPAAVWLVAFALATFVVHAIKARLKQRERWIGNVATLMALVGLTFAAAIVLAFPVMRFIAIAAAIPMLVELAVNIAALHPRDLKRIGWTLVAANTVTLLLLVLLP